MIKKRVAIFLCLMMFMNATLTFDVFASALSDDVITKIQTLEAYNGTIFDDKLLINSSITISEIEEYLLNDEGYPLTTEDGQYKLNPYVFQKYKTIAYTNESACNKGKAGLTSKGTSKAYTETLIVPKGKDITNTQEEYRYLGYKLNGEEIITNDFFPADFEDGGTDADKKSWVFNDPQLHSWDKTVLEDDNMLNYYLKSYVQNDDEINNVYNQTDYSIASITHVNELSILAKFPKVMADVSFTSPATLNMIHIKNGSRRYDSMRLKQFNYVLNTIIDNVDQTVKLPVGTETYDITYDVTTSLTNIETDGISKTGKYFSKIQMSGIDNPLHENKNKDDEDLPNLKRTLTKTIDLKGLRPNEVKTVPLNATSIVDTFDKSTRTHYAETVNVKVTLVANDAVDFIIKKNETDVTGANVTVNKLDFSVPLTVTLEDTSLIQSGEVTSREWSVKSPTAPSGWLEIDSGNKETIQYTLNTANRNLLIDGQVEFRLVLSTADGEVGNSEQFILPIEKSTNNAGGDVVAVLISSAEFDEKNDYYEVMEGQTFTLRGNKSYHKADLKITDYDFDVGEDFDEGIITGGSKKSTRAFYPKSDGGSVYKAYLEVTDEAGKNDTDNIRTKVRPAIFEPKLKIYGTFKENRKLSFFVENKKNLTYYPIDNTSLKWTITPLDGQGNVFQSTSSLNGSPSFDGQFSKKGRYKVKVEGEISSIYNPVRYHGAVEEIITIAEDLPPVADFKVAKVVTRDVENGLMTHLYLSDLSDSFDGDIIEQRIGSIMFDTDNDGSWDDETSIVFAVGNDQIISYPTDHVGKYKFEMKVREGYGQPTLSAFLDASDVRYDDTNDKPVGDKITDLQNTAPTIDLEVSQRKNVNAIIYEDLGTSDKMDLNSTIAELEKALTEKKINLTTHYLSPTETVGNRTVWTTYFDSYVEVGIHVVGQDEDRDDIDYVRTFRFLLDSYTADGSAKDLVGKDKDRFEFVGFRWGSSGSGKYKYKGRSLDYSEFYWKELILTYKENGVSKEKTYNFVHDWEYSNERRYDVDVDAYDYDTYDIVSTKLMVDDPNITRKTFIETNNTFYYRAEHSPTLNLPSKTSRVVTLKKYKESDLDNILNLCGEDDTFFLNLASKEENRLALNKTLYEKLKERKINYLTIDDYALPLNPITGIFEETFIDNDNNFYISAGKIIYKLVLSARYYNYQKQLTIEQVPFALASDKDTIIETPNFDTKFIKTNYSRYTYGWKDWWGTQHTMRYGLEASNGYMYDTNQDDYDYMRTRNAQEVRDAYKDPKVAEYAIGKNLPLSVERDGNLIGQSYRVDAEYYSKYNYIRVHKKYVVLGSGYKGVTDYIVDTGEDYNSKGLIHSNGNIYFRKPIAWHVRNGVTWSNYLVINGGTQNIEHMYYNFQQNLIYVETKLGKVYTYHGKTGKKTLLLNSFKERVGNSYKIADGQWMIDGKIHNYKEVFTNDSNPYFNNWQGNSYSYATSIFYINDQDEFRIRRKEYKSGSVIRDNDYLVGKDVKTIITKGMEDKYVLDYVSTNVDIFVNPSFNLFETNDGKFYEVRGNSGIQSWQNPATYYDSNPPREINGQPKNLQFIGNWNWTDVNDHNRGFSYQLYAEQLETGLGIRETISKYPKSFAYATLTEGKAIDCIGDSQLTSLSALSTSYPTLTKLKDELFKIYEGYSTSENMTVLLNEVVNTSMVMQDVENDPAYIMTMNTKHLDPNYYENSMGTDPNVGIGKAIHKFDYVGLYKMIPRVRDNPVGEDDRFDEYRLWNKDDTFVNVLVHRRPLAYFTTSIVDNEGEMTLHGKDNGSYDLDHESQANKGIIKWEWSLKAEDEASWQKYSGQSFTASNLSADKSYDLALRVQDEELVWSTPVIKTIESRNVPIGLTAKLKSVKPKFSPLSIPITEDLLLYDIQTTYPKALKLNIGFYKGDTLLSAEEEIEFLEGDTGQTVDALFGHKEWSAIAHKINNTVADGPYTLKIEAVDVSNASKSESIEFSVGVRTPIKPEPTLEDIWITNQSTSMQCTSSIYTDEVKVTLFKGRSQEETVQMTYDSIDVDKGEKMWTLAYEVPEDITNGLHTIEFMGVVHTSPYKRESKVETVQVVSLGFEEVILTGAWNHWRGQVDLFGERLLDMPYRFLSWEKIFVTTKTLGNPDRITLELSPELQAMSFTDDNGKTFYYEDDFDEEITFPLEFTKEEDNLWTVSYILPLADSTLSWKNKRERAPYEIRISAYKNGIKRIYEFNEANGNAIEITGNTTNLIYQQPVRNSQ